MSQTISQDIPLAKAAHHPRSVTWRSLLVGTIAVIAICALTPYNDFVLSDTSLSAGFLPLAAVLVQFIVIVGLNAPLHKLAPRMALRPGELTVVLLMTLIACGIPNWGLMRFLIPTPVSPFRLGSMDQQFWNAFIKMDLPAWLFPVTDVADGRSDPNATWFFTRIPGGETIPYAAWVVPLAVWGIMIGAMLATFVAIARLVVDQWVFNERLPFPLVQVQTALIEPPRQGRALNDLFRSPWLWVGLGGVFFIHSLSALSIYYPKYFPSIPLSYDFTSFISDRPVSGEPLSFLDNKIKKASISFIVLGVTYFIRSKVAFSLWGIFIIINLFNVQYGMLGGIEMPNAAFQDQHLGACVAFVCALIWIGREHWKRVVLNAIGRGTSNQYRTSFWVAVIGFITMVGWLRFVGGVQIWWGVVIVCFILTAHLVVSRVLAETGLPWYRSGLASSQIYSILPVSWFARNDIYFSQIFTVLGPLTTRDSIMGFTSTGLAATRQMEVPETERARIGMTILWTLVVGCVVAAAATLYCQYSYPTPVSEDAKPSRNYFGAEYIPRRDVAPAVKYFEEGKYIPRNHNQKLHMAIGFVITTILEVCALRYASWPLLPVGYVASYGAFVGNAWFSVFLGWLAKVLIVRFGGSSLYQHARPLFVGVIFGEALAAGIWVVINAIVVFSGGDIRTVKILL